MDEKRPLKRTPSFPGDPRKSDPFRGSWLTSRSINWSGSSAPENNEESEVILLSSCRLCSAHFSYNFLSGGTVNIFAGVPPQDVKYKAISHVWGAQSLIKVQCQKCNAIFSLYLKSAATFHRIMALAGPDSTIWIDNLSINQEDPEDIASQVAVMGDTYGKADCVSVLLPGSDQRAFQMLSEISDMARTLLDRKWAFDLKAGDEPEDMKDGEGLEETAALVRKFFAAIQELKANLGDFVYWQRAWTFQEWARAHDIEVAVDAENNESTVFKKFDKVKSVVIYATIMIADYKLRNGQYALMNIGYTRGTITTFLDEVKRLFPFEDAFTSYDEINETERSFQIICPHLGTGEALGLRPIPRTPRAPEAQFRARLDLMLDAFAGNNKREAKFEADLVCCWASMCNISYGYSKDDTLNLALSKVIRSLRRRGIRIYNFLVNIHAGEEIDFSFFDYAALHQQCNATNLGFLVGAPIFTGRADTVTHFRNAAMQPSLLELFRPARVSFNVPVKRVKNAALHMIVPLTNRKDVLGAISTATSGREELPVMFTDVVKEIEKVLSVIDDDQLMNHFLAIAAIPIGIPGKTKYFNAWAICPLFTPMDRLFVARESQNGTLVVAILKPDSTYLTSIIAYLTITDQQCGTFLLPVSESGDLNVRLKTPQRSDIFSPELLQDRFIKAHLTFIDSSKQVDNSSMLYNNIGEPSMTETERAIKLGSLAYLFGSVREANNNDAVEEEEGEKKAIVMVRMLAERLGTGFGEHDPKEASMPLNIDIGHPNLVTAEQLGRSRDVQRSIQRNTRRGSF